MLAEVDAQPPDVLRGLFDDAIQGYWDTSTYEAVVPREARETEGLRRIANTSRPARRLTLLTGRAGLSACHGEVLRPCISLVATDRLSVSSFRHRPRGALLVVVA